MIRFGCLGAARITPQALISPVSECADAAVTAVASQRREAATQFAQDHGIPSSETDYAALIQRADVDVIYNALPPSAHAHWACRALEAGKAVLCEKPMAMNAHEAERMAQVAEREGVLLMEAFHYRFHPAFCQALDIIKGGDLGRLQTFEGHFSVEIPERDGELRHELALGGGALMDLGCYPVHWARTVMGCEPDIVSATATMGRSGIDLSMHADLVFDGGVKARITTSMAPGTERAAWFRLVGSDASLRFQNPLAPHHGYKLTLHPARASEPIVVSEDGASEKTTYHYQLDHFLNCLSGQDDCLLPPSDGVANMGVIDMIYRAAGMTPRGVPNDISHV